MSKRVMDLMIASIALMLLAPLLLFVASLIRVTMGAPVLFRQRRAGLQGRPFTLYKFRTMANSSDAQGHGIPDARRLTSLGRLLRSTSVDELPELFNVLKGDMSVVGPRPLLLNYLDRYTPEQRRRHEVKPGMSGWAQVNGRNAIPWEQRFALDVWYVDNGSLWLDVKILALTIWRVVRREGISQAGHATSAEFLGPEKRSDMATKH